MKDEKSGLEDNRGKRRNRKKGLEENGREMGGHCPAKPPPGPTPLHPPLEVKPNSARQI